MKRIQKEERFLVFKRTAATSAVFLLALAAVFPSLKMLTENLASSGFFNFMALLFADWKAVSANWQSFAMVLLQSLPALSFALFLAVLLAALQSAKSIFKNIKIIRGHRLLAR